MFSHGTVQSRKCVVGEISGRGSVRRGCVWLGICQFRDISDYPFTNFFYVDSIFTNWDGHFNEIAHVSYVCLDMKRCVVGFYLRLKGFPERYQAGVCQCLCVCACFIAHRYANIYMVRYSSLCAASGMGISIYVCQCVSRDQIFFRNHILSNRKHIEFNIYK